jgi:hypothetical protein
MLVENYDGLKIVQFAIAIYEIRIFEILDKIHNIYYYNLNIISVG